MKKILLIFTLLFATESFAQENVWLLRFHIIDVKGNTGDFIKDQNEFYSKLAKVALDEGQWAGWQCLQSISMPNRFLFIHHFSSTEQLANANIWSAENVAKTGLNPPAGDSYTTETNNPMYIYQIQKTSFDSEQSTHWRINWHGFSDAAAYKKINDSWGDMVVNKIQKDVKAANWAYARLISNQNVKNGESQIYNGVSFDGYASMKDMLDNNLTNATNEKVQNIVQNWFEYIQKENLNTSNGSTMRVMFKEINRVFADN